MHAPVPNAVTPSARAAMGTMATSPRRHTIEGSNPSRQGRTLCRRREIPHFPGDAAPINGGISGAESPKMRQKTAASSLDNPNWDRGGPDTGHCLSSSCGHQHEVAAIHKGTTAGVRPHACHTYRPHACAKTKALRPDRAHKTSQLASQLPHVLTWECPMSGVANQDLGSDRWRCPQL